MRSSDLTIAQARRLKDQVGSRLRYLNKLVDRMHKLGFAPADPVYGAAIHARAMVQDLYMAAHYAGCKHGVGKDDDWPDDLVKRA